MSQRPMGITQEQIDLDDAGVPVLIPEKVVSILVQRSPKKLQADRALTKRLGRLVGLPFTHDGKRIFYLLKDCRRHLQELESSRIAPADDAT